MKWFYIIISTTFFCSCNTNPVAQLSPVEVLGREIFFDNTLSEPTGLSCATCHRPETGFADSLARPISEGAISNRFAKRNSMSIAYTHCIPALKCDSEGNYYGGLFWDGRVNSQAEQAAEPFVDPLEMGNHDIAAVVSKVRQRPYFSKFAEIFGSQTNDSALYNQITYALQAYQSSGEVNRYSSKFDAFIAGDSPLTAQQQAGYALFLGRAMCARCHVTSIDPIAKRVLFTDHTYDNLGVPRNERNPFYRQDSAHNPLGVSFIDLGLGATVGDSAENGKFRVPTLRNIELTAPYGHNGYFATLSSIVRFYNIRDVDSLGEFEKAEYPQTVNHEELGNLGLTKEEESLLVEFLKTLTDREKN